MDIEDKVPDENEVLKRMLATPHKPHKPVAQKSGVDPKTDPNKEEGPG